MTDRAQFWVLGAGGLGCPALLGLMAAHPEAQITLVDNDVVDATNLHRQVLYALEDVGAPKVEAAAFRLSQRAPGLRLVGLRRRLAPGDVHAALRAVDAETVVLECSDDPALKFAVNDAVLAHGLRGVIGGVVATQGQAMAVAGGHACYRCLFHAPPPSGATRSCAEVGVLGPVAGAIGYQMAHLATALRVDATVAGRLFDFDAMGIRITTLSPPIRPDCRCQIDPAALHSQTETQTDHGNRTHSNSAS